MSEWRKIIVSGSAAELRRINSGPTSITDESYIISDATILAGENFLPNLAESFQSYSSTNFTNQAYRIGYFTALGEQDSDISGFDNTDAVNLTDGDTSTVTLQFTPGSPDTQFTDFRYLYITLPDAVNIDQWTIQFPGVIDNPNFGSIAGTAGGISIEFCETDPSGLVGTSDFNTSWQPYTAVNFAVQLNLLFQNTNQTFARFWRIKHTFDNAFANTAANGQISFADIQAISNAGITVNQVTTAVKDEFALQVTGSAKVTNNVVAEIFEFGQISQPTLLSILSGNPPANDVFITAIDGNTLFVSASVYSGPPMDLLRFGTNAVTTSLDSQNIRITNTASIGFLDIDTGASFDDVVVNGSATFEDNTTFEGNVTFQGAGIFNSTFATTVISQIEEEITSDDGPDDALGAGAALFSDQTGRPILAAIINTSQQGGFVLDYTLSNGSAGRTGQFMLTKIGTGGSAIYDFTDTSTKHIGSETTIPFFSASLMGDNRICPMIVNGSGYTLKGFLKKLTTT